MHEIKIDKGKFLKDLLVFMTAFHLQGVPKVLARFLYKIACYGHKAHYFKHQDMVFKI